MATRIDFAKAILSTLGVVPSEQNCDLLVAVQSFEDSSAVDNPLDTTLGEPQATDYNEVGVKNYPNFAVGVEATVATLNEGRYLQFRDVIRGSDTSAMAMALANGGWAGTAPQVILNYTRDLEAMVHTVEIDREHYYLVDVAASAQDETGNGDSSSASPPVSQPSTPASSTASEPEVEKVESAITAQASEVDALAAAGKADQVRAKVTEIRTHLSELEDLVK